MTHVAEPSWALRNVYCCLIILKPAGAFDGCCGIPTLSNPARLLRLSRSPSLPNPASSPPLPSDVHMMRTRDVHKDNDAYYKATRTILCVAAIVSEWRHVRIAHAPTISVRRPYSRIIRLPMIRCHWQLSADECCIVIPIVVCSWQHYVTSCRVIRLTRSFRCTTITGRRCPFITDQFERTSFSRVRSVLRVGAIGGGGRRGFCICLITKVTFGRNADALLNWTILNILITLLLYWQTADCTVEKHMFYQGELVALILLHLL